MCGVLFLVVPVLMLLYLLTVSAQSVFSFKGLTTLLFPSHPRRAEEEDVVVAVVVVTNTHYISGLLCEKPCSKCLVHSKPHKNYQVDASVSLSYR